MDEKVSGLDEYLKILEEKEFNRLEGVRKEREKEESIRKLKDKLHDEKIRLKNLAEKQEREEKERDEEKHRESRERDERNNKAYHIRQQIELLKDSYRNDLIYVRDNHSNDAYFTKKLLEQKRQETLDNIQILNGGVMDIMPLVDIKQMENRILSKQNKGGDSIKK